MIILKIDDVVCAPWNSIESPKWRGCKFGVAVDVRGNQSAVRKDLPSFNSYGGYYQFYAVCTSPESAEAAKRLLSL